MQDILLIEEIPATKQEWFSWIPTNIGYLNFNYIADEKRLENIFGKSNATLENIYKHKKFVHLTNTNLSDINCIIKELFEIDEVNATADVYFENLLSNINGNITFIYAKVNNVFLRIYAEFNIERNGKLRIFDIKLERNDKFVNSPNLNSENNILNTIVHAIYTVTKKIVHGDNHHYQKIDTLIGVYTKFVPEQIITDLGFHIKRLDKFVKYNEDDSIVLLYEADKLNSFDIAEGFHSYIKTFKELFIDVRTEEENNIVKKEQKDDYFISYDSIVNTMKSIKAGINKLKFKVEQKKNRFVFTVSLLALFATLNIFIATTLSPEYHLSNTLNILAKYVSSQNSFLSSRDIIILILFVLVFTTTFSGFFIDYVTNVLRNKMKESNKNYSFFEVLILSTYINRNNLNEISSKLEINNLNKLDKYLKSKFYLIVTFSIICFLLLFNMFINSNWIYLLIGGLIIYLIILLFKNSITNEWNKETK